MIVIVNDTLQVTRGSKDELSQLLLKYLLLLLPSRRMVLIWLCGYGDEITGRVLRLVNGMIMVMMMTTMMALVSSVR